MEMSDANVILSLPEKARMSLLCNGNGKAGIRAVKAAQTGIHAFRGLNGFEDKGKVTWRASEANCSAIQRLRNK